jgi:hypothetical protein
VRKDLELNARRVYPRLDFTLAREKYRRDSASANR